MTAHRGEAWTDARLEQEIEQALAVDPSPEFLARVRTQIATAPQAQRWSMRWPLVVVSTAAVALIVTVATLGLFGSPRVVVPGSPAIVGTTKPPIAPPSATPSVRSAEPRRVLAPPRMVTHAVRRSTAPEVLIPEGEAKALRRLMRGLNAGAVDPSTLAEGVRATAVVQPATPIVVEPIPRLAPVTLEPLSPMTHQEGVRQ